MNRLAALRRAGRRPPLPLHLQLPADRTLHILSWLRILPGKRLVGEGRLDGERVLVKLFIAQGAARHFERELAGVRALIDAGIPTPALVEAGALAGGGCFIATEFIDQAATLQQRWDVLHDPAPGEPEAMAILREAVQAVAQLHGQGLTQSDLHLGNFLAHADRLYIIDGDGIEAHTQQSLPAAVAEHNLALLFGQLPPAWDTCQDPLLSDYLAAAPTMTVSPQRVALEVEKVRQRRLKDYLSKSLRDCSLFAVSQTWGRFTVAPRQRYERMKTLLANPDVAFEGPLLKDGGSSTVGVVREGGEQLVVKRYNIKGMGHWLKRFWRPSRAWQSWLAAHRLRFLGINTPEPLGMVESRFGPLRRRAWLVTEFCEGQDLLKVIGPDGSRLPSPELQQALLAAITALTSARISHGDFKATNLIWDGRSVWLIDLDAMQSHIGQPSWERAWHRDRARLIRNWPHDSQVARWLDASIPN